MVEAAPNHPVPVRRRVGLLCVSAIPDDPRVRRQGDLLTGAGWEVVAIGLPGARSTQPDWTCLSIGEAAGGGDSTAPAAAADAVAAPPEPQRGALRTFLRPALGPPVRWYYRQKGQLRPRLVAALGPAMGPIRWGRHQLRRMRRLAEIARLHVDPGFADTIYWRLNDRFGQIYDLARRHRVDLWLANDWTTLPIARRLAAEQGVAYGYDTHELAVDEYAQNRIWRLAQRPVIAAIESGGIRNAAFVTCVSDGIADRLKEVYELPERPVILRNMPMYGAHPFRPTGERIEVLYHGAVAFGRGLEACIRSVALWRGEFRLTIRGPSSDAYLDALRAEARAAGVTDRVVFEPAVPMTEMVARAASFDVGLFALPGHSLQNVYVLPNKFFEYTMAGLALCLSDLPEMTRLLKRHDLGVLFAEVTPQSIAEAVNRLDRASIDRFKRNALVAARELNWQAEGAKLLEACAAGVPREAASH